MKELSLEKMKTTEGGKFWGRHDYNCKTTSMGTWCCWDYAVFWIDVDRNCGWAHTN